jgi:hypothetical protein
MRSFGGMLKEIVSNIGKLDKDIWKTFVWTWDNTSSAYGFPKYSLRLARMRWSFEEKLLKYAYKTNLYSDGDRIFPDSDVLHTICNEHGIVHRGTIPHLTENHLDIVKEFVLSRKWER